MNIGKFNHETRPYTSIVLERIKHLPPGGKMGDLPPHLQHESFIRTGAKKTGGPNMRLLRLEHDKPALTVTAYIFNKFVHPQEDRYLTPREAATLQDFPLEYAFMGTQGQVHQQIGNAVPVRLAKAIAQEVARYLVMQGRTGEIKIASYFCGAGGLDLGFEQASTTTLQFKTRFATDIDVSVAQTIQRNRPEWHFQRADIQQLDPEQVRNAVGGVPDVVIGGPPCQPFSVAGKQKAIHDPLGVLYRDYIRHIALLQPRMVVMENVYGLAQVKAANMVEEIYQSFARIGYNVTHRELLAADYGTPQRRRRLFFVAARDLAGFRFPEPSHAEQENVLGLPRYVGAGEILAQLPPATLKP